MLLCKSKNYAIFQKNVSFWLIVKIIEIIFSPSRFSHKDSFELQGGSDSKIKPSCEFERTKSPELNINLQGDQDHFLSKEMLISPLILKLHKNP